MGPRRREANGSTAAASGGGSLLGSTRGSCSWSLTLIVLTSVGCLIFAFSQLALLPDCAAERDRAGHAEDVAVQLQARREEEKQAFERVVAELQEQLQEAKKSASKKAKLPAPSVAGKQGSSGDQSELLQSLQAQVMELSRENKRLQLALKDASASSPAPAVVALAPPASHGLRGAGAVVTTSVLTASAQITEDTLRTLAADGAIGVAVISCKRPKYLQRAMDSVFRAKRDPKHFPLVISQDAHDAAMTKMIEETYVTAGKAFHMHHDHEESATRISQKFGGSGQTLGYVRIAQHFGFAMRRMFDDFGFKAVIFLEEDLEVSPDFFSYFDAMLNLLRSDKDLFCVSAWNDNGYQTLVEDPKAAFRTDFFPGLGWMMEKSMWAEVRQRWAEAYWDEFMRRPDVRKGRHCIRPEISRSFTFGEEGVSAGQFYSGHLSRIKLNDVYVDWANQDLSHLASASAFDEYLRKELRKAKKVSIRDADGQREELRIEYQDSSYQEVASRFSLMPDEKEGIRRMSYRGVIPFSWQQNRVYLYTGSWPGDLP